MFDTYINNFSLTNIIYVFISDINDLLLFIINNYVNDVFVPVDIFENFSSKHQSRNLIKNYELENQMYTKFLV